MASPRSSADEGEIVERRGAGEYPKAKTHAAAPAASHRLGNGSDVDRRDRNSYRRGRSPRSPDRASNNSTFRSSSPRNLKRQRDDRWESGRDNRGRDFRSRYDDRDRDRDRNRDRDYDRIDAVATTATATISAHAAAHLRPTTAEDETTGLDRTIHGDETIVAAGAGMIALDDCPMETETVRGHLHRAASSTRSSNMEPPGPRKMAPKKHMLSTLPRASPLTLAASP